MKKTVSDLTDVKNKRVLVRVDFNVPLENGEITDDRRIEQAVPTIQALIDKGAKVILMSHLGRPKAGPDPKLSLRPIAKRLAQLIGRPVDFAEDCVGCKRCETACPTDFLSIRVYLQEDEETQYSLAVDLADWTS